MNNKIDSLDQSRSGRDSTDPIRRSMRPAMAAAWICLAVAVAASFPLTAAVSAAEGGLELIEVRKIWDGAPHNAFTDLVRWKGKWWCAFREGTGHVNYHGKLRVIISDDGEKWESAALIAAVFADLRDAKLAVTPAGELMLYGAGAMHPPIAFRHQTVAWFSRDGRTWSDASKIADPNYWLWRVTWHKGTAYGFAYGTRSDNRWIRLYKSSDGRKFDLLADKVFTEGYSNETSLVFSQDGTCYCLLRRDAKSPSGKLGVSQPPYTKWEWKDLGTRIGGPQMIELPDGRLLATVRLYDQKVRTSVCWIDRQTGRLTEALPLPSGGDCSYAGMVIADDGIVWISYYSSHEGKTSIYLAKVRVGK